MVDLLIRNIRVETHQALKRLAAERDTSLADQARSLLEAATRTGADRLTPDKILELRQFRESVTAIPGPDPVDLLRDGRQTRGARLLGSPE